MPYPKPELLDLARRLLRHHVAGTTDSAPSILPQTMDAYLDADRHAREVDAIFRRRPLALALSAELRGRGDYKAVTVLGTPVLMVRGRDARVRAFLNVCRHRGALICPVGSGHNRTHKFSCPYHAWVYDSEGRLAGVFGERTFGDFDHSTHGLTTLACEERAGFVWVTLTPGVVPDLDEWLQGFDVQLAKLDLGHWHLYRQTEFASPGWKVTWDGYLEGYHQAAVHPETVGKNTVANLMAWDTYGPHQRFVFARKSIGELASVAESEWQPSTHIRLIHSGFPNLSVSGVLEDYSLVSQVYPTGDPMRTTTVQTVLVRRPPASDAERAAADAFADMGLRAVRNEDYEIAFGVQSGLAANAGGRFLFGRNEPTLQHFHRWIDRLSKAEA
jgi:phenylpropionate dioxygenase-like ring-hydroxylating dioxygenase large terminal subunit